MTDPRRSWSPIDEATWLARIDVLRVEGRPDDWWVRGPCPGCGHAISRNVSSQLAAYFVEATPEKILLRCNCGQPHDGRPPDALPAGCGAAGGVVIAP